MGAGRVIFVVTLCAFVAGPSRADASGQVVRTAGPLVYETLKSTVGPGAVAALGAQCTETGARAVGAGGRLGDGDIDTWISSLSITDALLDPDTDPDNGALMSGTNGAAATV